MRIAFIFLLNLTMVYRLWPNPRIDEARKLYESRKLPEALAIVNKVTEGDKDYPASQYWLGRIAFDERRYDDAAEFFEEAADKDPSVQTTTIGWEMPMEQLLKTPMSSGKVCSPQK